MPSGGDWGSPKDGGEGGGCAGAVLGPSPRQAGTRACEKVVDDAQKTLSVAPRRVEREGLRWRKRKERVLKGCVRRRTLTKIHVYIMYTL